MIYYPGDKNYPCPVGIGLMRDGIPCHSRDKAAINSYKGALPRIIMGRRLLGFCKGGVISEGIFILATSSIKYAESVT